MQVLKFGGTSVGTPQRMKEVSRLVTADGKEKLVVLSAMSGTTNSLVEISDYLYKNNIEGAVHVIAQLEQKYMAHVEELYKSEKYKTETRTFLKSVFDGLRAMAKVHFTSFEEKVVLAQGELMSTNMVTNYLLESGIKAILLPALEMVRTDKNAEPDTAFIREKSRRMMEENKGYQIYITQGFICRNAYGDIDNLLRGGSDYTACLLGAALEADEIQIWTDIDGMHNNDPRIVEGTVPVRLLNTMDPTAPGTIINNDFIPGKIKAVAARDGNVCIQITSSRMLLAYGFLRKVFEIFEQHKTSIDMICTSEVGVSVTVDNLTHLDDIVGELKKYGTVQVDRDMTIICVVGDLRQENKGFETLACEALREIPVRMISYGGSNHNISFLIHKDNKKATLQALSKVLF